LVAPLYEQAEVCARRLAGDDGAAYSGSLESATLKVSGVAVASMGRCAEDPGCDTLFYRDPGTGLYRKLLLTNGHLHGAVLVGDTRDAAWFGQLIAERTPVADLREGLIFGREVAESLRGFPLGIPVAVPSPAPIATGG
jgi:nitrite reductase (NADH) large subunit